MASRAGEAGVRTFTFLYLLRGAHGAMAIHDASPPPQTTTKHHIRRDFPGDRRATATPHTKTAT
jgi:hypothetical protein